MKYKTKTTTETFGTTKLQICSLANLNETIDDIFSYIESASAAKQLTKEDTQLLEDLCPYFGSIWPSARALSKQLSQMGTLLQNSNVVELGCGLGIPSLVAAKAGAHVTSVDFHPEVPNFLAENCRLNQIDSLSYQSINWRHTAAHEQLLNQLRRRTAGNQTSHYDWVIASDVLYEPSHSKDVANAMALLAGKKGRILMADPARPYLQGFVDQLKELGFRYDTMIYPVAEEPGVLNQEFSSYTYKEIFLLSFQKE